MAREPSAELVHRMIEGQMSAAHLAVLCEVIGALIENNVLNQSDMIARLERLSSSLMTKQGAEYAAPIVDIVRDYVAGEQDRKPSQRRPIL